MIVSQEHGYVRVCRRRLLCATSSEFCDSSCSYGEVDSRFVHGRGRRGDMVAWETVSTEVCTIIVYVKDRSSMRAGVADQGSLFLFFPESSVDMLASTDSATPATKPSSSGLTPCPAMIDLSMFSESAGLGRLTARPASWSS